jgi:hypothetical protein
MAIGLAIAGAGLAYNIYKDQQAGAANKKAQRAQRRINEATEARKRRATIREAQVSRSKVEAMAAVNGGAGTSSRVMAATNSVGSQLNDNLNFLANTTNLSNSASSSLADAARLRSQGAIGSAIGQFAMTNAGAIDNLFASDTSTT